MNKCSSSLEAQSGWMLEMWLYKAQCAQRASWLSKHGLAQNVRAHEII